MQQLQLSNMYTKMLPRRFVVFVICIDHSFGIIIKSNFVVETDKRIVDMAYGGAETKSDVACASVCQSSSNCTAANYRPETRNCQLFNQACFITENITGWSYLIRPPVKRTFHYNEMQVSWEKAKKYCESRGGRLANVMTATDHEMIMSLLNKLQIPETSSLWIGGSDQDNEGEWVWSNGCRFNDQDFNFWSEGEPNNMQYNEHCLVMNYQKWNDVACSTKKGFICEMDAL